MIGPFAIPAIAGAIAYLLSNPSEIGPRKTQTKAEAAVDLLGVLPIPGSRYVGGLVGRTLSGGVKSAAKVSGSNTTKNAAKSAVKATSPYKRPNNATTKAQRKSVQGSPCVDCGKTTPKQVANHKEPLVKEYYETGKINTKRMRDVRSVNSQCPTGSAKQGAELSRYSWEMKKKIKKVD